MRIAERVNKSITLGTTNYIGSGRIQRLENLSRFIRLCDVFYPAGSFYERHSLKHILIFCILWKFYINQICMLLNVYFLKFFQDLKFVSVVPASQ